jgi:hypothetical protein
MRLWMTDPKIMCRQHLLGEHLEVHMFISTILSGKKITGFINNNLLEPHSLSTRHFDLTEEMERRGYNHKTPVVDGATFLICMLLPHDLAFHDIDKKHALIDLLERCPECAKRFNKEELNG